LPVKTTATYFPIHVVAFNSAIGVASNVLSANVADFVDNVGTMDSITMVNGLVYGADDLPVAQVVIVSKELQYEPGTSVLAIDAPSLSREGSSVITNYFIGKVIYTPTMGTEARSVWDNTVGRSTANNRGVRKFADGDTTSRKLVAGTYDVTVVVYAKNTADNTIKFAGWRTLPSALVITRKPLANSMVTITLTDAERQYSGTGKSPRVAVSDGSYALNRDWTTGHDQANAGFYVTNEAEWAANVNVGPWPVAVTGTNNYRGDAVANYSITTRELQFDPNQLYTFSKEYDGSDSVTSADAAANVIAFTGYAAGSPASDVLTATDYVIRAGSLKYSDRNAGNNKTVVANVTLAGTVRNFTLKSASFSTQANQVITRAVPRADLLQATFDSPQKILTVADGGKTLYNGSAKPVSAGWKSPVTNSGGNISVFYTNSAGLRTSAAPVDSGDYLVDVAITNGGNNVEGTGAAPLELGTLSILSALPPEIDNASPEDTAYYSGESVVLRVSAKNPKDGKTSGLTYQWLMLNANTNEWVAYKSKAATQTVDTTFVGQHQFRVAVTYKGTEQVAATDTSRIVNVTVRPPRVSLIGASVFANTTYEYNGLQWRPAPSDFTVTVGSDGLNAGVDYDTLSFGTNKSAGDNVGRVTLRGIGAYKDTVRAEFTITKRQVNILEDLTIVYNTKYTGEAQKIKITPRVGLTGLGAVTDTYDPAEIARVNAGSWDVFVEIAEGDNFLGIEEPTRLPNLFRIGTVEWDTSMISFAAIPRDVKWDGTDKGIAVPAKKGVGTKYTGTLGLVYVANGVEYPNATGDSLLDIRYAVTLTGVADSNFQRAELILGYITVHNAAWVSVAQGNRELPNSVIFEQAAVAPVKANAATVTVGPNPVQANGTLSIFWNGSDAVSGKLTVFSAVGKKITTVKVNGTGEVGAWNANGAAEGTYLLKGILKDRKGAKVQVSALVSVTK
jgi:hypothetical protein